MEELNTLVYEIVDNFNRTDDFMFTKRVESLVIGAYATLLKRDYDKYGSIPQSLQNTIKIKLDKVKEDDSCSDLFAENCKVYRSTTKIPGVIKSHTTDLLMYVGEIHGNNSYSRINPEDYKFIESGTRFIRKAQLYSYINDYIYTYNSNNKILMLRGVFSDPRELINFKDCDGEKCLEKVLIPMDKKDAIRKMIYPELNSNYNKNEIELEKNNNATTN